MATANAKYNALSTKKEAVLINVVRTAFTVALD